MGDQGCFLFVININLFEEICKIIDFVESLSLKLLENNLLKNDLAVKVTLLGDRVWTRYPPGAPRNPNHSMILNMF